MQLDHAMLRTRDISGARDFFLRLFDMQEGPRPKTIQRFPGCWLFADGKPTVHIIGSRGHGFDHAAEVIDHVGFRLEGYQTFRSMLDRFDIRYSTMDLAAIQERRLFFHAPGGPLLETVFSEPVLDQTTLPNQMEWKSYHERDYWR